jgi:hypothetical protein
VPLQFITDLHIFVAQIVLLITWIKWIWKLICTFNACFSVNRENIKKLINRHKRCILEVLARIRKLNRKSTVTFRYWNDTGHFSDVETRACTKILETVPNPENYFGEPPHTEAQPPHAVTEPNWNLHFIFPYLFT